MRISSPDHPMFFNQLFSMTNPVATLGDWVTSLINSTMYTYEVAGPFVLMEEAGMFMDIHVCNNI